MLNRDSFLSAPAAVAREEIAVPALGGSVFVYGMTAGERDSFEVAAGKAQAKKQPTHWRARLMIACVRDENGRPLFDATDLRALSALSIDVVDSITEAASRLSRFTKADVEELEGN